MAIESKKSLSVRLGIRIELDYDKLDNEFVFQIDRLCFLFFAVARCVLSFVSQYLHELNMFDFRQYFSDPALIGICETSLSEQAKYKRIGCIMMASKSPYRGKGSQFIDNLSPNGVHNLI